jgi:hypothetical protein
MALMEACINSLVRLRRRAQDCTMNKEGRNDRVKLAYHRMVARALNDNPGLLEEARAVVRAWMQDDPHPSYVDEWNVLLSLPLETVRREITRRTPTLTRLRISSPFYLTPTRVLSEADRLRLRRAISRPVTVR